MNTPENSLKSKLDLKRLKALSLEGAAATAGAQVIKFALQIVFQIWIARLIGPAEYGLVAMVAPILAFIGIIGDMGVGTALVQQKFISQSQISALFWLNAALSLIACVGLITVSPLVGALYREPKTVAITVALALLLFVGSFSIHPSALLTREMRLARRAAIECGQAVASLSIGVLTAIAGCGYWSLIYAQAAGTVTSMVFTWWSAGWLPSRPRWDPSAVRVLRFGTSLTLSNIAMYVSMSADNMIVGVVKGKVALGLYDKAYRLVVLPLAQLSAPIGRVAVPLLSRLTDQPERYASAFKRMVQVPNLICIPGLICGMFLAPQLVHVFLGPTWIGIAGVFSWVCFGGLPSFLYGSASWLFTSQGRGRDQVKWAVITSSISVLSFVLGIRWGAVGVAAFGAVGFVFIQTPLIMWAATKVGPVNARCVTDAIAPMVGASAITAPIVYLFTRFHGFGEIAQLTAGIAVAYIVYFSAIALMPSGREMLCGSLALVLEYLSKLRASCQRAFV